MELKFRIKHNVFYLYCNKVSGIDIERYKHNVIRIVN